ncbi:MAG: purine-nucleoside phosphorylase [Alphaproteobacteria bacterium]|nr:purine-nucleoside phosphorylase [Alphaproteobacteria bacterium]
MPVSVGEVKEVVEIIEKHIGADRSPAIALVLGSGLGDVVGGLDNKIVIPFKDLPGFPNSSIEGHAHQIVYGEINGIQVLCIVGRIHFYEGHTPYRMSLLIRAFKKLGVERLLLTNAAGSLREDMEPGSIMSISDHINFSGFNPLIGSNDDNVGPRFPSMTNAYDADLRAILREAANKEQISLREGVYLMTSGPNFETPAEIRAFKVLGGDAVGMSTAIECIVAIHCGMKVAGLSVITNYGAGMAGGEQSHAETLENAALATEKVCSLIKRFVTEL